MEKPSAILLDIEGTTTDPTFVSRKLIPVIESNVPNYFRETYSRSETKELIKRIREARAAATEEEQLPRLISPTSSRSKNIKSISDFALELMRLSCKSSGSSGDRNKNSTCNRFAPILSELSALVWCWVLEEGKLLGHVYDEVTFTMHQWKEGAGLRMYVFSGHQNIHQRLLLCATNHGNLEPLISGYFDQELGPTTKAASYRRILKEIALEVPTGSEFGNKVLYITSEPKQASAALEAGLKVAIIQRPESSGPPEGLDELKDTESVIPIKTFDDLKFK